MDSQDSPRPGPGGSHHLPPYNIVCAFPWGPHPNGVLSQDSQVGVPKLPKVGLPWLWRPITLCVNFRLRWGLNQSYSPRWELFNGMSHATCTQGNRGDSRLLMVANRIANLTLGPSFGHNLCFRCPNGSCEPISNIYVSIDFQWYGELLKPLGVDPCNRSLNIRESTKSPIPNIGVHLRVRGSSPSHSFALSGAWECGSQA